MFGIRALLAGATGRAIPHSSRPHTVRGDFLSERLLAPPRLRAPPPAHVEAPYCSCRCFGARSSSSPHQNEGSLSAFSTVNSRVKPSSLFTNNNTVVMRHRHPQSRRGVRIRYQQPTTIVPVSAVHLGQGDIDLKSVQAVFNKKQGSRIEPFGKTSIVVRLAGGDNDGHATERFVSVYRFGSIIFFNVDDPNEVSSIIAEVQKHATKPILPVFKRKESFAVHVLDHRPYRVVQPTVSSDEHVSSVVTADYCIVPELDMNGVAVISNIMAQSVALDTYNNMIERLLSNFESINQAVTKTGDFAAADVGFLFKTVAQNNSIFIDMISKIRIKDRATTAWDFVKHETIHYGLKDEFEIDERFENIEVKANLVQQNAEFFLQVIKDENSSTVEWIIIALIVMEGVLMIVEMSGLGGIFFRNLLS